MADYYVVKEKDDGSGCLTAVILIIMGIAVVAVLAAYVLGFLLALVAIIGAIVGTFMTLKNYIGALKDAISYYGKASKPVNSILPTFVYRWFKVMWETTKQAWRRNMLDMKNFFMNMGMYKFFSFKKWINFFSALAMLVFGTIASILLFLLNFYLILFICQFILMIILAICGVCALIGLVMALIKTVPNYLTKLRDSYSSSGSVLDYATDCGFSEFASIVKDYWRDEMDHMREDFDGFRENPWLSVKKWLSLCCALMTVVAGAITFIIFGLVHIMAVSVLFVVGKIVGLIKR